MNTRNYSHYYLYAKNHYKKTDLIEDLKKVHGFTFEHDAELTEIRDIISVLLKLVYHHFFSSDADGTPQGLYAFEEFVQDISPEGNWRVGYDKKKPYVYEEAIIRKCLSMLRMLKVKEIHQSTGLETTLVELDTASADCLPLAAGHTKFVADHL